MSHVTMGFGGRKAAAKPMVFPGGSEEGVRVSGSKQSFPHSIPHLRVYRMSRAVRRTGLGGEALSTGPVGRSCGPAPSIPWTAKPERGGTGAAPGGDGERAGGRGGRAATAQRLPGFCPRCQRLSGAPGSETDAKGGPTSSEKWG